MSDSQSELWCDLGGWHEYGWRGAMTVGRRHGALLLTGAHITQAVKMEDDEESVHHFSSLDAVAV
jgi:hypothetical protein